MLHFMSKVRKHMINSVKQKIAIISNTVQIGIWNAPLYQFWRLYLENGLTTKSITRKDYRGILRMSNELWR